MNVTCKRLLSWLVVVTMVLSMVPVVDLSNFAVTTKAAVVNPGQRAIDAAKIIIDKAKDMREFPAPEGEATTITKECPVCGTEQVWTPCDSTYTGGLMGGNQVTQKHFYLTADVTLTSAINPGNTNICLNLNGKDVTSSTYAINHNRQYVTNIIDTVGGSIVTGTAASSYGAAINLNNNGGGTINIYGGTYEKTADSAGAVVNVRTNGGTINMYAGTINASEASNSAWATTIALIGTKNTKNAVFNLYGGDIKCGTMTALSGNYLGNICVGWRGTTDDLGAEFNMYGGTVSGGRHTQDDGAGVAGNIAVSCGNTLNVYGGTIYGGKTYHKTTGAATKCGNIGVRTSAAIVNISGGTIVGDISIAATATTKLAGDAKIVTSLEINDETETAQNGGIHVTGNSNIDISELEATANIAVTGAKGAVFTSSSEGSTANAANVVECFHSTDATLDVFKNNDNRLYFNDKQAEVGTFDPWNCQGKAYCEACSEQQGKPVLVENWTALSGATARTSLSTGHYYLAENNTTGFTRASGATVCLELNGMDVTVKDKVFGNMTTAGTLNIMDRAGKATVAGWQETYTGEVFDLRDPGAIVNIYGGTFVKHADASTQGSIIYFHEGGTVNMYDGTINGSGVKNTAHGSCVELRGTATELATFKMYGGEIKGGASTSDGGNVTVGNGTANTAVFEMHGGTVSGGIGRAGGNFYVNAGQLSIYSGTVKEGVAECWHTGNYALPNLGGGNILVHGGGKLHMEGGVVFGGKTELGRGGNILVREDGNGTVEITGGKIYGGEASSDAQGHNVSVRSAGEYAATLTISGTAEIAGDIVTGTNVTTILSGAPKIKTSGLMDGDTAMTGSTGLNVTANSNLDITGLSGGEIGDIQVSGKIGVAFTPASDKAAEVVKYFDTPDAETKVVVEKNKLTIYDADINVPEKDNFDPANCGGMAYCQICGGEDPVEWTAVSGNYDAAIFNFGNSVVPVHHHYYLSDDATFAGSATNFGGNNNILCLHLNGKTLTAGGTAIFTNYGNTIHIMGDGIVSGTAASGGATINVNNKSGIVNIYGGTFKNVEGAAGAVIGIGANGGTVNMIGGTIDASEGVSNGWATAVSIMGDRTPDEEHPEVDNPGVFNMHGGTIKCGITASNRGNIMVGYDNERANGATFNLIGGTVIGGTNTANSYATFLVQYGGELNISGGKIYGGKGDGYGDNIFVSGNATNTAALNISGGEICGDIYTNEYGVITLSGDAKVLKELTVEDKTYVADDTGLYIYEGITVDITGLTAEAKIYIAGKEEVGLTTGEGDTTGIKAYEANKYAEADENGVVYLHLAKAAIQLGKGEENQVYYPTFADALAAYKENSVGYLQVYAAGTVIELKDQTVYIDNRGFNVTIAGSGIVYAMDSSNDDYVGAANWTVAEDATVEFATDVINPVNGRRYIVIDNGNGTYDAHRIQMYLTGISLRPTAAGLYYKAAYKCDAKLAALVTEYGIALRVDCEDNKPELDQSTFGLEADKHSILEGFTPDANHTVTSTSTLVYGIFKDEEGRDNATYGELAIEATPYIKINGNYLLANIDNATANAAVYEANNGRVYEDMSMYDVLEQMNTDAQWARYTDTQKQSLHDHYETWAAWGNGLNWTLSNITGYQTPEAEA